MLRQVKKVRLIAFQATTLQEVIYDIPNSCGFTILIQEHSHRKAAVSSLKCDLAHAFLMTPIFLITDHSHGLWLA